MEGVEKMPSNKKDEFLDAEKRASELIDTLEKLKKEMEAHATAAESLSEVQSKLVDFLENNKKITEEMLVIIKNIKDIGGVEIFNTLENHNKKLKAHNKILLILAILIFLCLPIVHFIF